MAQASFVLKASIACLGACLLSSIALAEKKQLRLEEIFADPGLTGTAPTQFRWSPDGRWLSYILPRQDGEQRDLWGADPASGEKRVLVSHEQLDQLAPETDKATADERERERRKRYSVASYVWSPDSRSILLASSGQLYLYDVAAEKARALAPGKKNVGDPKFSPNGRWVSFTYEHDIWVVPGSGGDERRLTTGGNKDLLHGELDWVYPEELGIRSGYAWSPDSRRVAFLELDQSAVPSYPIPDWTSIAPQVDFQRYPLAGKTNPRVRLGVVEANSAGGEKTEALWISHNGEYLPRMDWVSDGTLSLQTMNRLQTELELVFADAGSGLTRTVLVERDPFWVNVADDLKFLDASQEFVWTSERSGFRHIYLYGYDGKQKRQLTEGEWEVKSVAAWDKGLGWLYYLSNEHNRLGSDLYRVKLDGSGKERLTERKGTHGIEMSPGHNAYSEEYSGLTATPEWRALHLPSGRATTIHSSRTLEEHEMAEPELIELQAPDKALIRGLLLKPKDMQAGRKHPALVYVYGGPRAPTIRDAWGRERYLFHQYLAQRGYVVFYIDDRASSILGHRYETALSRGYGPTALKDQLVAVEYLKNLDYVDAERVAIWGWSGGGFSTCFALTHSNAFRAGIAGAPVTDWQFYDSVYTERYMGLPEHEAEAYRTTSCVQAAANLQGRLLLVHGTADDNVHFQNTVKMVEALIDAGKPYDLLIYPGKTHGLYGTQARVHMYRSMEEFLDREIGGRALR